MPNERAIPKGWVQVAPDQWVHPSRITRICASEPEPNQGNALVQAVSGKDQGHERFEICFVVYALRPCDWDNYFTKPLQDCCREAGFIPDDDWQTLQGRVITKKAKNRKEERTEITITPLQ